MKKAKIIGIAFYVLAGLILIYSIWAVVHSINYISEAIKAGQLVAKGNEYNIVNFYMSNGAQYVIYAALLFASGMLLRKQSKAISETIPGEPVELTSPKDDSNLNEESEDNTEV